MGLADRRIQYETAGLGSDDLDPNPMTQLLAWYHAAEQAGVAEPNAMTVATVDGDGAPDARVVLARAIDDDGVVFYTNFTSTKGAQLDGERRVALTFAWLDLHRQVRLRGRVSRVGDSESDAYFAGRPRASQLGAWASPQSRAIDSRDELERRLTEVTERFAGMDVPRPPHWGGYRVNPESVEFWQGRPDRLHDRFRYTRAGTGWAILRLAP